LKPAPTVFVRDGDKITIADNKAISDKNTDSRALRAAAQLRYLARKAELMHTETFLARQGDVVIQRVTELPSDIVLKASGKVTVALGEVTGHSHTIAEHAELYVTSDNERFVRIMRATYLGHDEHASVTLEPGVYRIGIQREYQAGKLERRVVD